MSDWKKYVELGQAQIDKRNSAKREETRSFLGLPKINIELLNSNLKAYYLAKPVNTKYYNLIKAYKNPQINQYESPSVFWGLYKPNTSNKGTECFASIEIRFFAEHPYPVTWNQASGYSWPPTLFGSYKVTCWVSRRNTGFWKKREMERRRFEHTTISLFEISQNELDDLSTEICIKIVNSKTTGIL